MNSTVWLGLGLSLAAGLLSGNCMLPSKFVRGWAWENMWLVFTLVSLVAAPGVLTLLLVKDPSALYASLGVRDYALPFLFGFGWGIAQVLFGLSIARLGMALGYAIIVGLGALLGTMVPILFQRIEVLKTSNGVFILSGVVVMVAGIALAGRAGRMREGRRSAYLPALFLAVLCGLMAPMLNFSLAFGQEIGVEAVRRGTAAANAAYAVWPVALLGGLGPNLGYSVYLLYKNKTWGRFRPVFPDLWFPVAMGVLWIGAVSVYGTAAAMLGALGTSVGWGLFQIFMIMTANAAGLIAGEWKQASDAARRTLGFGLGLLAVATLLMAMGNRQG